MGAIFFGKLPQMINLEGGLRFLTESGLNLVAVLDRVALPDETTRLIEVSGIPLDDYRRLVLIGHGGRRMWEALHERGARTTDPIDHYSVSLTRIFVQDYLGNPTVLWLYPDAEYLIPLQQLGEAAGWSFPTPLGTGISPKFGVWFAYRAAFLTNADLPLVCEAPALSPCATCVTKRCMSTCPASAIKTGAVDIDSCAHHRLRPQSRCADRCLARLACPMCPQHCYTLPQIQYHYSRSLETLRAWYDG
ncbi:MAG: hypothetical protein LJE70_20140 [Chromatiaceae bacterium]|nr:hypothetical protein [Chromatiaceae bacterium]